MIELPKTCVIDKFIPKKTFYKKVNMSNVMKKEFDEKLSKIYWKYILSEYTIHIPKTDMVEEIEIFEIELREKYNSKNIIKIITKNILYPILFYIKYENEFQYAIKYNDDILFSEWNENIEIEFSGISLEEVYNNIVRCIANIDKNKKNIDIEIQKQKEINRINQKIEHLENKIRNEKQFNIKCEYNEKIKKLKKKIEELNNE